MKEDNNNKTAGGRTMEDIIYDAVEQENRSREKKTVTGEYLAELAARDRKRSARRFRRTAGIAAALLLAAVSAFLLTDRDLFDAGAGKGGEEETVTEDGVVVEDEGWGSGEEDMVVFETWEEAVMAKEDIPQLLIPEYVPDGYGFESLRIEGVEGNSVTCIFSFAGADDEFIEIHEFIQLRDKTAMAMFDGSGYIVETKKGEAHISAYDTDGKKATIQTDGGVIADVICSLSDEEIIDIINEMR